MVVFKLGQSAICVSTLRPFGSIEVEGHRYEAKTEEGWIDEGTIVFILGVHGRSLLVGSHSPDSDERSQGLEDAKIDLEPKQHSDHSIPVHGPEFWLEWDYLWVVGGALGIVVAAIISFFRSATTAEFAAVPLAAAASGFLLQVFIRGARDLAGPHADHRPYAYLQILVMLLGLALGGFLGMGVSNDLISLSVGMFLGCLAGGLLSVFIHAVL